MQQELRYGFFYHSICAALESPQIANGMHNLKTKYEYISWTHMQFFYFCKR